MTSFQDTFRRIIDAIAAHDYAQLHTLDYQVPEAFNWTRDVFEAIHVASHPQHPMLELLRDSGDRAVLTYAEAAAQANRLLNFMRDKGLQRGQRVFVMCGLHPGLWLSYLAVMKGGFVMIPAAGILTAADIAYRLEKAQPGAIITDNENLPKIQDALNRYGIDIPIKLLLDTHAAGWQHLSEIDSFADVAPAADTKASDVLFWFFTSGTTGFPKIVAHTHASYPLGHLSTAAWIGLSGTDKHYNISQPGWAKFAWSCFFAPLNAGATVFCFRQEGRFDAKLHLSAIQNNGVTTLCAPPTALRLLIQEDLKAYDLSRLKACVSAGEPLNPEVIQIWKDGTGHLIRDGYGQTESTCMVYNLPGAELRFGSMGKPSFLYDIVIADEAGNELPLQEEGQIAVRMHPDRFNGIFREYIGAPEKAAEAFRHRLYYTGDKAYRDADGYVWFVGRDDDVIKSSDYRIGPFEVESVLLEVPEVLESAVVGSPHALKGLEVKAFVVLKPGVDGNEALARRIFEYSREHTAPYKAPRIIEFVDELPKTISGKIRRVELRAREAEGKAAGERREREYFR